MTIIAITLLIVSATIHASWNMLGKRQDASIGFFLLANSFGWMVLGLGIFTHLGLVMLFPRETWMWIAITGLFQAIYYWGLACAYRSGQLSVVYPLARSAPVVLVLLVNLAIGRTQQLSLQAMIGMALIAVGGLVLPVQRWSDWRFRDYLRPASLFALMAAIGTTGYSIIDDTALRSVHSLLDARAGNTVLTLVYAVMEGISSSLWLLAMLLISGQIKRRVQTPTNWRYIGSCAVAGIGVFAAYGLVLVAMGFAKNVSYVVAFRQLSIPIGAMLGIVVLKESVHPPKLIGVGVMLLGLILVALR